MNFDRIIAVRNTKTIYCDGDLCLKVFNEGTSKAGIFNEALNQARAQEAGLNVPSVIQVSVNGGKLMIVSDYVEGKSLAELIKENPEKRDEYLALLASLQTQMHKNSCRYLVKQRDRMIRRINESDIPATVRYDFILRLEKTPCDNKLCHGDFTPSNIIISDGEKPYIIDWAHASQGNPEADAAKTYISLFHDYGNDAAEKYLSQFCSQSKVTEESVKEWLDTTAASESSDANSQMREFLYDNFILKK